MISCGSASVNLFLVGIVFGPATNAFECVSRTWNGIQLALVCLIALLAPLGRSGPRKSALKRPATAVSEPLQLQRLRVLHHQLQVGSRPLKYLMQLLEPVAQ